MSINFVIFDKYIYDWITSFTTNTVIWFNTDGVKPNLPFIALNKQSFVTLGHSYISPPDGDGYIKIVDSCELTINFQAFGPNSYGVLHGVKSLISNPISQNILIENGISLVNNFPIQNITQRVDQHFEERASMDLLFRFSVIYGEDNSIESGLIEKVEIDATYNHHGNIRNETIYIDSTTI